MAITTTKYGFRKPELSDAADITANNSNWDILENELINLTNTNHNQNTRIEEINNSFLTKGDELNNKITEEVNKLQPKITFGFDKPSGGFHGDVYVQLLDE